MEQSLNICEQIQDMVKELLDRIEQVDEQDYNKFSDMEDCLLGISWASELKYWDDDIKSIMQYLEELECMEEELYRLLGTDSNVLYPIYEQVEELATVWQYEKEEMRRESEQERLALESWYYSTRL